MPPPAPMKPQIMPIIAPQTSDCTARFFASTCAIVSFVVITGRRMNLTPNRNVMKTEKPPIVAEGTRLAA